MPMPQGLNQLGDVADWNSSYQVRALLLSIAKDNRLVITQSLPVRANKLIILSSIFMIPLTGPRAVFHMGLHKTGTTSYQGALNSARDQLKERGVLYPLSIEGAVFPQQHADLAHLVFNQRLDVLGDYLRAVKSEAININCRAIIFSSEDFSSLGYHPQLLKNFTNLVDEIFTDSKYFLTLRNAVDHLSSSLTEMIEGNSIAVNVSHFGREAKRVLLERANSIANIKNHFGLNLTFLDYNFLISDGNLCKNIHNYIDFETADIINESKINVGFEKDIVYLLTTCFRGIISLSIDKPVYSGDVIKELKRLLDLDLLRSAFVSSDSVSNFRNMYKTALDRVAYEVVTEAMPRLLEVLSGLDESVLEYYLPGAARKF